eukprot:6652821-Prymnesium_polylepis.1
MPRMLYCPAVAMRLRPTMTFYQGRIPVYERHNYLMKMAILLFGVAASILARYEEVSWVAVVTAASSAFTSWAEFSDSMRKTERYNRAVGNLKKLLNWWDSLSEVQKASKSSISNLIRTSESIISEERLAWTSTASQTKTNSADSGQPAEGTTTRNEKTQPDSVSVTVTSNTASI